MLLISYDITKTKTRTKFAKLLSKYGNRVQYSVWQIENSPRVLRIIETEITHTFTKLFKNTDSVYIYRMCEGCERKVIKFGYAQHEDKDVIVLS